MTALKRIATANTSDDIHQLIRLSYEARLKETEEMPVKDRLTTILKLYKVFSCPANVRSYTQFKIMMIYYSLYSNNTSNVSVLTYFLLFFNSGHLQHVHAGACGDDGNERELGGVPYNITRYVI